MRASEAGSDRLFRHDRRIATNATRANLASWQDRLVVAAALLIALAVVRWWFGDQPWKTALWAALAAGILAGAGAARLVAARLQFHGYEGVLAAEALRRRTRWRYVAAWHGIAIGILAAITLIARPSLLFFSMAGYLGGIFVAGISAGIVIRRRSIGETALARRFARWLHSPAAGIVAAAVLLLSTIAASALGTKGSTAVVGIEAILFAGMLTTVDHNIVRFMIISGQGPWRIVVGHAQGTLLFAGLAAPLCGFAVGPVPAAIVVAAATAMLLILTLRIFAYCVHGKRFADLLVSIVAGLLLLAAYAMPVLLPFLVIAVLWHLQRRAAPQVWLLA